MPKYLSLPIAVALVAAGILLNAVVRVPASNVHLIAVLAGQACWGAAMFIFLIRGNIYANAKLSYDGPGWPIFNTVKWGLVTVFLFCDAFLLERIWEWYFILPH